MKNTLSKLLCVLVAIGTLDVMASVPPANTPSDLYKKIERAFNASTTPPNMTYFQIKKVDQQLPYSSCVSEYMDGRGFKAQKLFAYEVKFTVKAGNGPLDPAFVKQGLQLGFYDSNFGPLEALFLKDGLTFENGVANLDRSSSFISDWNSPEIVEACNDGTNTNDLLVNSSLGLNANRTSLEWKKICNNGKVITIGELKESPGILLGKFSSVPAHSGETVSMFYYYCWK